MSGFTLNTASAQATQALGRHIGAALQIGDLVLLAGTLGTGKTTITQGIAWGAGVTEYAHSPTFVLVHEYAGRIPIYHLDLYRFEGASAVDDIAEVEDLGIDEMMETGACIVEWAERAAEIFPGDFLEISLAEGETLDDRVVTLTAHGIRFESLVAQLAHHQDRGEMTSDG
jgi:tRNA threonylcarbamoyladenosine biosynthesis protein TsaE